MLHEARGNAPRGKGQCFTRRGAMCNEDDLKGRKGIERCLLLEVVKYKLTTNFIGLEHRNKDMCV